MPSPFHYKVYNAEGELVAGFKYSDYVAPVANQIKDSVIKAGSFVLWNQKRHGYVNEEQLLAVENAKRLKAREKYEASLKKVTP